MKTLYTYRFIDYYDPQKGAGHIKYYLELDRGKRVNVESEVRKLAKLNKDKMDSQKVKYLEPKRILVGINKFRRLYQEGRIVGQLPELIRTRLGAPRLKERSDKGLKKKVVEKSVKNEHEPIMYYIWDKF